MCVYIYIYICIERERERERERDNHMVLYVYLPEQNQLHKTRMNCTKVAFRCLLEPSGNPI